MDQAQAIEIAARIGAANAEVLKARDEQIGARSHVIYALATDPDWVLFDFNLSNGPGEWWEYDPIALVSGVLPCREPNCVRAVGRSGRYTAVQVLCGECEGANVEQLGGEFTMTIGKSGKDRRQ